MSGAVGKLAEEVKRMTVSERQTAEKSIGCPVRPGVGTIGGPIRLFANSFAIDLAPGDIVQYDVNMTPDVPRNLKRMVMQEIESSYKQEFGGKKIAYDAMANIYTFGAMPKSEYTLHITIERPRGPEKFTVVIRKVAVLNMALVEQFLKGQLDYTPYEIINALEVVMRHPLVSNSILVGRSLYAESCVKQTISRGCTVWSGFFQSIRPGVKSLLLNMDTSSTAFYQSGEMTVVVAAFLNTQPDRLRLSSKGQYDSLQRFVRGMRVQVTHRPNIKRSYKVVGLSPASAAKTIFKMEDGSETNVVKYFADKYSHTVKVPDMPCLMVGSKDKPSFLPMDCCVVPSGQRYIRKLDDVQTADMIKIANKRPSDRFASIQGNISNVTAHADYYRSFGMTFKSEASKIMGRVLEPPTVFYNKKGRSADEKPMSGAWNLRDKVFDVPVDIKSWGVLNFGQAPGPMVEGFVRELVVVMQACGMNVASSQQRPLILNADSASVEQNISNAYETVSKKNGSAPQFILVVLPTSDAFLYGEVKRACETVIGFPTQCMLQKHMERPSKQYCANLCLKINAKLGGRNSTLGTQCDFVTSAPTMLLGADVTHPGIGEVDKPSIAAVVASMDRNLGSYATEVAVQGSRKEIIEDLQTMVFKHLSSFATYNKRLPSRILFYRDGVSEGQFAHVLKYELSAIQRACAQFENYTPKITVVLVQKRHHTRFFVASPGDADRSGNIPAGTVVDNTVVHPTQFDFYLCSHAGLQGTSRPTHYHVVHDENGFTADALQTLSNNLCYSYASCTRSVSVVPPAYYAHLAAFRARFHFAPDRKDDPDAFKTVKETLCRSMYYA